MKKKIEANLPLHPLDCNPQLMEDLIKPLDDQSEDILDIASISATEIYYHYLNNTENSYKLFSYLEGLSKEDKGFTYSLSSNSENKLTGFVWMTSVMRSKFEKYHKVLFLDAVRRQTNVYLWPYMSVVIVNDLGEAQPIIEGIMMAEREESYKFMIKCALEMSPNVYPKNIKVVFGDEFFTQDMMKSFGLLNAKLFHDHWHLKLNQEKSLGIFLYDRAKENLTNMMLSSSEEMFDKYMGLLIIEFAASPKVINLVNEMSANRHMFAAYIIDSTEASFYRRGSSPSEQNHSSIVNFAGKKFSGELEEILLMLLKRHSFKCVKTNDLLERLSDELRIAIHKIKQTSANTLLLSPMKHLNPDGMKLYNKIMRDVSGYMYDELHDGTCYVYHSQYPSKKRYFVNKMSRCT